MKNESKERAALRALVGAITAPDAFEIERNRETDEPFLVENEAITKALREARSVLSDEDREGYPTVTLTLPLRSARAWRDSMHNALCFLRGMRAGAGPDAEDGPEASTLLDLRDLAHRLDEVVEPALIDFEGPHEMPF